MRRTYRRVEVRDIVVPDLCNKCGQEMLESNAHHFDISGGWGNTFPGDSLSGGGRIEFDLCSDCLEAFVKTFALEPDPEKDWVPAQRGGRTFHVWYGEWVVTPERSAQLEEEYDLHDAYDLIEPHPAWADVDRGTLAMTRSGLVRYIGRVLVHETNEVLGLVEELFGHSIKRLITREEWGTYLPLVQGLPE